MPRLTIARIEYTAAYRALRLMVPRNPDLSTVEKIHEASTRSIIAGDVVWKAYGKMGGKAIVSFNDRQATEWKLMRLHDRLERWTSRKAFQLYLKTFPSPFASLIAAQEA